MSDAMLLNTLLLVIGVLFLAIGSRRGVIREVLVSTGLLTGVQLGTYWARPWGSDFADFFGLSVDPGRFIVSAGFILGAMLILGYGGAIAIDPDGALPVRRSSGGLLGLINGALLVGFILRDVERFVADDATIRLLRQSGVAWTLLRHPGWIMLGAATAVALMITWAVLSRRSMNRPYTSGRPERVRPTSELLPTPRRSPRLRWGGDGDKVEPFGSSANSTSGRFSPGNDAFGQTMPLAPVDGGAWIDRSQTSTVTGPEWLEIRSESQGRVAAADAKQSGSHSRCAGCGEQLSDRDLFCPKCGRAGSN